MMSYWSYQTKTYHLLSVRIKLTPSLSRRDIAKEEEEPPRHRDVVGNSKGNPIKVNLDDFDSEPSNGSRNGVSMAIQVILGNMTLILSIRNDVRS